jgi:hypothetical protein
METLLDRHLPTFDRWLHAYFMPSNATAQPQYYVVVLTLLDQLNLEDLNWDQVSVILQHQLPSTFDNKFFFLVDWKGVLFDRMGVNLNIVFTRIVSKFLMDQDRAGSLWVNSHKYADLASYISEILYDK